MPRASDVSPSSSSLIAFKPRQVLLLEQQQLAVSAQMAKAILENPAQLKPEDESLLLFSVALWLENKGFSKVLKRFLSAAQIQDDTWKAKALNLNEVFSKYQEIRNRALEQVTSQKKQGLVFTEEQADITEETNGDANCTASEQIESKNKKKKGKGDTRVAEAGKKSNITTIDEKMNEPDVHDKGDLSYKIPHDLSHKDHKFKAAKESNGEEVTVDQSTKKQKDKKKKSSSISQSLDADEKQIDIIPGATESENQGLLSKKSNAEVLDTEITIHKKSKKKSVEAGKKFTTIDEKMNEPDVHDKGDESYKIPDDLSHKDHKFKASKESNGEEVTVDQSTKKQKDKKKKSSSISQSLDADEKQIDIIPEATESENQGLLSKKSAAEVLDTEMTIHTKSKKKSVEAAENVVNESKKASKKRKRMAPDENENHSGEGVVVEESKSKKSKGLEEGKDVPQVAHPGANGHAGKQNKEENLIRSQVGSQDLSTEQTDGSTKIIINENRVDTSGQQKSARKQRNHSAEPKTVNAFQRVKVDEVEFVDERLQDNSYWAKDGAETGYGAKAQEVLGQVRGRDFRHEKTKKKRGSYRGGQIDLQSHSIKFNYPDE